MTRCRIVSGAGEYADPWHPFAETTAALVDVLAPLLGPVEVRTDVETALAEAAQGPVLLVVSIGDAGPGSPSPAARDGLRAHRARGGALLAVHSAATAFPDWPEWESMVGGRWVRGTTFHPPYGPGEVVVDRADLLGGLCDFSTSDELYTALRVHPAATVVAHHDLEGTSHPLAWFWEADGARAACTALGHDGAAYQSPQTRDLVSACAAWLVDAAPA